LPCRTRIGLVDRFKDLTDWLTQGAATASQGHLTSEGGQIHRPSRHWYGQLMPGSWAPNVDSDGVDGKLAGVVAIQAHDPGFDENVFLAQVQRLFFGALEAWMELKPALSQGVMASLIWEEQKTQIAAYRERGWRNVLSKLTFTSAVVAGAVSDTGFDTVTVRINANSADYDVDAGGNVIRGDTQPWDWTEDWIFQRPSIAKTEVLRGTTGLRCCSGSAARAWQASRFKSFRWPSPASRKAVMDCAAHRLMSQRTSVRTALIRSPVAIGK